ncbi:MAG: GGDEF domain-containing protein [Rubrivivax sp.]|nr:GGDEF domain-containing protein [Rubrivivax sp.]
MERRWRGRPQAAIAALDETLPRADGPLRVEMLALRGLMQVTAGDAAAVEAAARGLEALPASRGSEQAAAAAALLLRAAWQAQHGALGRADRLLAEAAARLPHDATPLLRLRLATTHGRALLSLGRLDEAVRQHQQAVNLADALREDWRRSDARSRLAYALLLAQQHEVAWRVNQEAMRLAAGDALALSGALTTQGMLLGAQGRRAEELQVMRQAVDEARRADAPRDEALTLANLADHYLKQGDWATALALSREALPLAREVRDATTESVALTNAGLALISMGRRDEGMKLVQDSLVIEQRAGALTNVSEIRRELGLYLEKAGFLPEAWAALTEHRRLADEVFRQGHQQAVLELQEAFDAERRARELALLKTENALKEQQLLARDLQQGLWAVGIAAGGLLLAVVAVLLRRLGASNRNLASSNHALERASERDPLTGLANRRHLLRRMPAAGAAFEGSLLLVDIDHFKRINDEQGHAAGDAVLVELARRLVAALRDEDLVVRWGGEEFLVLVPSLPAAQVEPLAGRLLAAIGGQPVAVGRTGIAVTASIGFATFPLQPARQPVDWQRAVDLVDTAMYLAKAHGRNRAYGLRALHEVPAPGAGHGQPAAALEAAWRAGRAELTRLRGPRRAAAGGSADAATPVQGMTAT